jgi:hypothetical protein
MLARTRPWTISRGTCENRLLIQSLSRRVKRGTFGSKIELQDKRGKQRVISLGVRSTLPCGRGTEETGLAESGRNNSMAYVILFHLVREQHTYD